MAGNGPDPNPNAKRRNARVGMTHLPAGGRTGRPPAWPLRGTATAAEKHAWAQLWATPQAVAWERLGWTRVVARYVRVMLKAEDGDERAWAETRLLEKELGLTPAALRSLMWVIDADEVAEKRQTHTRRQATGTDGAPARKLRVVDPSLVKDGE